MSVKKLQKILEEIDYPILIEIVDNLWCRNHGSIEWNAYDNKEDLENGEGETYGIETRDGELHYDGYLVVNGDTRCGETVTYMFNLSKECSFE